MDCAFESPKWVANSLAMLSVESRVPYKSKAMIVFLLEDIAKSQISAKKILRNLHEVADILQRMFGSGAFHDARGVQVHHIRRCALIVLAHRSTHPQSISKIL